MTRPIVRSGALLTAAAAAAMTPALLLAPRPGYAQVEEIIVSTRKREESLQEVPIAINAFSADQLEKKDIDNIADLAANSSSITFDEGSTLSDTRVAVRGLSPTRGRQNVAVLVDGIDVSTEAISNSGGGILLNTRLVDVQRIEVVKGPQNVLYGRSAFAGAIQYVTKDPAEEFEADVLADGNEYDQFSVQGGISGPIFGEKLGFRLNGAWWDEDGFFKNSITGARLRDDEGFGLALTLKSQVTDNLSLKFRAEHNDQRVGPSATVWLPYTNENLVPETARTSFTDPSSGITYPAIFRCFQELASATYLRGLVNPNDPNSPRTLDLRNQRLYAPGYTPTGPAPNVLYSSPYCETGVAGNFGATPKIDDADIALSPNPFTGQDYIGVDRQLTRFSLLADWDIGRATVTSRTGWLKEDAYESQDIGKYAFAVDAPYLNGNPNLFSTDTDKVTKQFSQELSIRSSFDGPIQVSAGALLWKEDVLQRSDSLTIQASGSHCSWLSPNPNTPNIPGTPVDLTGAGDDTACYGYSERPVLPLITGGADLVSPFWSDLYPGGPGVFGDGTPYNGIREYRDAYPVNRDTEHRSLFGQFDWNVTDRLKLVFEGRYNVETVTVKGPLFYEPGASGGPGSWNPCGFFFRPCTDEFLFAPPTDVVDTGRPFGFAGGPFWSQANFQSYYDSWTPNENIDDDDPYIDADNPGAGRLRDLIPATCLNDPAVQKRLADADAGLPDPFDLFNPYCNGAEKRDDSWFSPKLTANFRLSDDVNLYASWAKAAKAGGFSTLTIGSVGLERETQEYEQERMTVYEIGAKTQWFDRQLVVNGAVFFQDYTDKQTLVSILNNAGDRLVSRITNVCCAEVYGLELDASWAPDATFLGGNWFLGGSYTWLDAKYKGALVPNNSFTFITAAGNCSPTVAVRGLPDDGSQPADDPADSVICNVSLDGNQLEDAPRNKVVGSLGYTLPLTDNMDAIVQADVQWTDRRYIENTNESWVDPYSTTNLRIGLTSRRWEVIGYVTNLFENDTVYNVINGPGLSSSFILGSGIDLASRGQPTVDKTVTVELPQFRAAILPDPRVVGLRAKIRFGGQ